MASTTAATMSAAEATTINDNQTGENEDPKKVSEVIFFVPGTYVLASYDTLLLCLFFGLKLNIF